MTYQQLLQYFQDNSKTGYLQFNNTIVNGNVPMFGCTVPAVRKIAKQFCLQKVLQFPTNCYYEVDLLKGIVIANCKLPFQQKTKYLTIFADTIENWAVCDCCVAKFPSSELSMYLDYFVSLTQSNKPFVCRYGVVNLMVHYLTEEYIDKVFDVLCNIKLYGEYYVDMAVAWLIATALAKCRDKTVEFMQGDARKHLNVFAYNKALQKMRDSYRVSPEDKQWTYSLKR